MTRRPAVLFPFCLCLLLAVLSPARAADAAPARVISIGGAVTEVVFALGAGDRVIAVDSTSRHPPIAEALPDVGYMRALAAEPIIALAPDLVLAVEDAGPAAVIDQLRAAGTRIVTVPDEPSPEGVRRKIAVVAAALGLEAEGRTLAARIDAELARLAHELAAVKRQPSVLFLLSVGNGGAPLAGGAETSAAGIVELAGGRNAVSAFTGYKPLSPEAAVAAAPDVVLVTERTLELLGGPEAVLARPEVALTPAGRRRRLIAMDGLLLLGFGPRTPQAARQLAAALHPAIAPDGDGKR